MALYSVSRVDAPAPGEFVEGLVLAAGAALARNHFAGQPGATRANLTAKRVDVAAKGKDVTVLTTVFDESPVLFEDNELAPDPALAWRPANEDSELSGAYPYDDMVSAD